MSKKNVKGKRFSLEEQVNRVIVFFRTHERAAPIAVPLILHKNLDVMVARYLFDCYIHWRRAVDNYLSGNVLQAKKDLMYSLGGCRAEAYNSACHEGLNDFSIMLLRKPDNMLDDAIETVFADECPARKADWTGFCKFRTALESSVD